MDAEFDADFVPDGLRAVSEAIMRSKIMEMAGKVKGFSPPPFETATTEAEAMAAVTVNYSAEDAMQAFNRISGGDTNVGVVEFQSIVGKLPIDDLQTLKKFLEEPYFMMQLFGSAIFTKYGYRLHAELELTMRKSVLKMTGKLKGIPPPLLETLTTEAAAMAAAETNYCIEDAMRAFRRISGDNRSAGLEFHSIVGKLPFDDLLALEKLLEEPYHAMMRTEMGVDYPSMTWLPEVKAASGSGDGFTTKVAGQAIVAMLVKGVGGALLGAFDLEPFEKSAGAVGLMSVIGGMVVQDKKPGLSRAMVKFGSVAIALAMIGPMAGSLENVIMAWVFAVLAVAIVAVTATFC